MNKDTIIRHAIAPAIMPVIFFAVALTPVDLLGCKTRGLVAFSIAFVSGLAGLQNIGSRLLFWCSVDFL